MYVHIHVCVEAYVSRDIHINTFIYVWLILKKICGKECWQTAKLEYMQQLQRATTHNVYTHHLYIYIYACIYKYFIRNKIEKFWKRTKSSENIFNRITLITILAIYKQIVQMYINFGMHIKYMRYPLI